MSKILENFRQNNLTLIVSLPQNSPEMALAALEGGAHALKVHLNLSHPAAGVKFGTFAEEQQNLSEIISLAQKKNIPVGVVLGKKGKVSPVELSLMVEMGIDFFDVFLNDMEDWLWGVEGLSRMVGIPDHYLLDDLTLIENKGAHLIKASVVSHKGYGKRLTIGDLKKYIEISNLVNLPVVVPSQRIIRLDEVPSIWDTGVKGIMIGALVTGLTASSVQKTTADFRSIIDNLD